MSSTGSQKALQHASAAAPPQQAPQARGQYQLQKLRARHHQILRLAAAGLSNAQISQMLNISSVTVSYTLNSEVGKKKLAVMMGEADGRTIDILTEFKDLAPVAIEVLEEVMLSPGAKDSDRISAADKVLNGAGFGKRIDVGVTHQVLSANDVAEARKAAREKARLAGNLVEDAEYTDLTDDGIEQEDGDQ